VVGRVSDLSKLAVEHRISEIVLPENEMIPYSEAELHDRCLRDNLQLTKLGLYSFMRQEERSVLAQKAKSTVVGN